MVWLLLLVGCGLFETEESLRTSPPPVTEDPVAPDAAAVERARAAAADLQSTLRERLQAAMAEGGPPRAVEVCSQVARQLAEEAGARHDARVGRSSHRLRNPDNAGPLWVQAWVHEHAGARADAVSGTEELVETPEGRIARVVQPIPTGEICVACHGPAEQLSPEVRELLAARYPQDAATGFAPGDLRGAVWAEAPVR